MSTQLNEGDKCPRLACTGHMAFIRQGDCTCHLHPPCGACVEALLVCDKCGEDPQDQDPV